MALILHIADLHLVSASASRSVDDHKAGLIPSGDRITHHAMLRSTLQQLAQKLADNGEALDAIVVTGDVADRNNEGGYEAFLELMDVLGTTKPTANRIVVLAGNHDVKSGLRSGDPDRYERFVRFIRRAGFVTPLLAGVDSLPVPETDVLKHLVSFDDIQLIPIDSSAYSQVLLNVGISETAWNNLEAAVRGVPAELEALRKLKLADAARVSGYQLDEIRRMLGTITNSTTRLPLRIAALHHHLLPVSTREEVKGYESLTNLGLIRQFLRDQGIAIVLHGHKHTQFSYVDHISSYQEPNGKAVAIRVISGAAASGSGLERTDVLRLIEIEPTAGILHIHRVGAGVPGTIMAVGAAERLTFSRPGSARVLEADGCTVIEGEEVELVYPQLVATVSGKSEVDHVVCRVEHSPKLEKIAPLYPGVPPAPGTPEAENEPALAADKRLEQFRDLVTWWQFPTAPSSPLDQPAFTHGSRIRRYNGHLDQVAAAIEALVADRTTSRGIIILLNPPADRVSTDVPFPSFCLIQFKVQLSDNAPPILNCTAFFRKQEVRYWWLVNLAELSELQREICDGLGQKRDVQQLKNIRPGSITTIAARAHAGKSAPKVQVPLIDRYYSLNRERLIGMVNAVVWDHMPGREEYADEWLRVFFELNPPKTPDPDGLAIAQDGLKYVKEEIGRHSDSASLREDERLRELHRALEQLLAENQAFAVLKQKEQANSANYNAWRERVKPLIEKVIELSYGRIVGGVSAGANSQGN
jgi:3',5'-cyclic AMP phosphodiesterase CpdA